MKYFIYYNGKSKEVSNNIIEKYNSILIECTTLEELYKKNEKHYVIGLVDEDDEEKKELEKILQLIKGKKYLKEKEYVRTENRKYIDV